MTAMEGLTDAQILVRLERLESFARQVSAHLGIPYDDGSDGVDPEVIALARAGDRMGAAKMLSDRTGVGFVEAQRIVNAL